MSHASSVNTVETLPENFEQYTHGALFKGINPQDCAKMLGCLNAQQRRYSKGEYILHRGDKVRWLGLVMEGLVTMERSDVMGNLSILGNVAPGGVFAEAFACNGAPSEVDVVAVVDTTVAHIDFERILSTCPTACTYHSKLVRNLFNAMGQRNLALTRKIADVTPRTIRGRLMSYLSDQATRHADEKGVFHIPYSRQQLADYLCVDRSALSTELNNMRREGLIDFEKNAFWFVRK